MAELQGDQDMKLDELIQIASSGYPDDLVMTHYKAGVDVFDGLAKFIETELKETYDEDATTIKQLDQSIDVIHNAISELEDVLVKLESARDIEEDNETCEEEED
jgi:protein-tyrosine phosphatase